MTGTMTTAMVEAVSTVTGTREDDDRLYNALIEHGIDDYIINSFGGECWVPRLDGRGKPYLVYEGRAYPIRRTLYRLAKDPDLMPNQWLYQGCETTLCVNPDHCTVKDMPFKKSRPSG